MTFPIIKNTPMPPKRGFVKYPFAEMEIGDAFDVAGDDRTKVVTAASYYGIRTGRKYSVRKIDANTSRVWRVS